ASCTGTVCPVVGGNLKFHRLYARLRANLFLGPLRPHHSTCSRTHLDRRFDVGLTRCVMMRNVIAAPDFEPDTASIGVNIGSVINPQRLGQKPQRRRR
ncbi:MAG: hypothetical protein AAGH82_04870, partial [Pseudomonadota bacterium]